MAFVPGPVWITSDGGNNSVNCPYVVLNGHAQALNISVARMIAAGSVTMTQVQPWHSSRECVHHDNVACAKGIIIPREECRIGTGNLPRCEGCAELDRRGM